MQVDTLSDREIEFLASLKRKPIDFETYPPVFQTQCLVEYLIQRGAISFTAKDVQDLFRHAVLKKALADQPNRPIPSVIRKYINTAIKDGKLPLTYSEDSDRWLVQYPVFRITLCVEVQAKDAIHAKDAVKSQLDIGNQLVSESVTKSQPWVVTIELSTKFTSRSAVINEVMELMSVTARQWTVAFKNGEVEVESTGQPQVGRFKTVRVKLVETFSAWCYVNVNNRGWPAKYSEFAPWPKASSLSLERKPLPDRQDACPHVTIVGVRSANRSCRSRCDQ
jgi:hypothetical protein